jgi:hypothetical protein
LESISTELSGLRAFGDDLQVQAVRQEIIARTIAVTAKASPITVSLFVVDDFRIRTVAAIGMFRLPPTIGELIEDFGIAAFNMLTLGRRFGGGERAIVIRIGLRPDVPQTVAVAAVMLADVVSDSGHAVVLLGVDIKLERSANIPIAGPRAMGGNHQSVDFMKNG